MSTAPITDNEKASCYIDLAKINQENLWKRRGIEWKINFGLWTALAVIAGFIHKEGLADSLSQHYSWIRILLIGVFVAYVWQNIGTVVANEKDLDWILYYKARAESSLDRPERPRARPEDNWWFTHYIVCRGKTWREQSCLQWLGGLHRTKLNTVVCPIAMTCVLLLVLNNISTTPVPKVRDAESYHCCCAGTVSQKDAVKEAGSRRTPPKPAMASSPSTTQAIK